MDVDGLSCCPTAGLGPPGLGATGLNQTSTNVGVGSRGYTREGWPGRDRGSCRSGSSPRRPAAGPGAMGKPGSRPGTKTNNTFAKIPGGQAVGCWCS